jgi:DNA-binding transcriptional regulator GbsR (MarR family)
MLNQELIEKFYRDVESLKIKKKGAVITKATGFSKSNVSEYLRKIKTPSENFIIAFYEHFGNMLPKSSINVTTDANRDTTYALPQIAKDLAEYNKELPMGDLKVTLKDYVELWKMLYAKEEERGRELITIIKDLAKGQNEITEVLKPIKERTESIEANLDQTHQQVLAVKDLAYITARQLDDQREALGIILPGQKNEQPVPFVKKDKASAGQRQDGGKKDSRQ